MERPSETPNRHGATSQVLSPQGTNRDVREGPLERVHFQRRADELARAQRRVKMPRGNSRGR